MHVYVCVRARASNKRSSGHLGRGNGFNCIYTLRLSLVAGGFQYPAGTGVGGRTGGVAGGAKGPKPGRESDELLSPDTLKCPLIPTLLSLPSHYPHIDIV